VKTKWNIIARHGLASVLVLAAAWACSLPAWAQIIVRPPILKPVLPNPEDFVEITAGADHTCARKVNGKTYCWGRNDMRQLGIDRAQACNGSECLPQPELVMTALQVEAGGAHTCAIDPNNRGFCWGSNSNGQAGVGSGLNRYPTPTPVAGSLVFKQMSAGQFGTCGATTQGVFCWGNIINGSTVPVNAVPPLGVATPVLHLSNTDFGTVSVGNRHVCSRWFLASAGMSEIYCWGANDQGQSGLDPTFFAFPNFNINLIPPAFQSSLGRAVAAVSAGGEFSCADRTNGTVACTGANAAGQLGAGDFMPSFQARVVGGGLALHGVSAGADHACALDASGRAMCWGRGNVGQLGQGAFASSPSPLPVAGGRSYRAIAAGNNHSCAIGTDNHIYCWGWNTFGQIGVRAAESPKVGYSSPFQAADPTQ
jgi:alpha-tubulin suppressor-like RCC1 family protein